MNSNVRLDLRASGVHYRRNLSGQGSTEEKTGHSHAPSMRANPCTIPFRSLREASYSWRELCLLTPAALSTATGGSSADVNISGFATPAPLTSRSVLTPPWNSSSSIDPSPLTDSHSNKRWQSLALSALPP